MAYKINTAFYEALGVKGWEAMNKTVHYIGNDHFKIADAKRGDIGNTSSQYAKAFFETMPFDAMTVAPYMGEDSIKPFLEYKDKWAIVLGLTSNEGAKDFEMQSLAGDYFSGLMNDSAGGYGKYPIPDRHEYLYEHVLKTVSDGATPDNLDVCDRRYAS